MHDGITQTGAHIAVHKKKPANEEEAEGEGEDEEKKKKSRRSLFVSLHTFRHQFCSHSLDSTTLLVISHEENLWFSLWKIFHIKFHSDRTWNIV